MAAPADLILPVNWHPFAASAAIALAGCPCSAAPLFESENSESVKSLDGVSIDSCVPARRLVGLQSVKKGEQEESDSQLRDSTPVWAPVSLMDCVGTSALLSHLLVPLLEEIPA